MMLMVLLIVLTASQSGAADYYTAAVVEYATPYTPMLTADEVLMANAAVYADYMANASLSKVDIIVFPEGGLFGHGNRRKSIPLPAPANHITPCDDTTSVHMALVMLSCAARKTQMYTVINLSEQYYNATTNETEYYNSNVAFNRNGTIVGRYRKYNPYGEPVNKPVLDHHYFETDFGVRFGMFICFDIDFLEPGVTLVREFGIKHFAFPHCWISELPFLTAIQAQWGWAYSLDAVLLASGCNDPSAGGTGSGIYHGKLGALKYFQTNMHTSKMLISQVPISFNDWQNNEVLEPEKPEIFSYKEPLNQKPFINRYGFHEIHLEDNVDTVSTQTNSSLWMLKDYMDVYKSHLLLNSGYSQVSSRSGPQTSSIAVTLTTETTLCQNNLCCDFQVQTTSNFNQTPVTEPGRGDDFTHNFYRLVAFDGVRWYGGGIATGGIQVCGVVSCTNESLASCGLRADDSSSQSETYSTASYGKLYKTSTVFDSISITANFIYNKTFVYPDILVSGSGDGFGALVSSDMFTYDTFDLSNGSVLASLKVQMPIPNLISAAIYARQCDRDGQKRTEAQNSFAHPHPQSIFVFCILFLCFFHCIFTKIF